MLEDQPDKGMSLIVKTITRLTVGLILLYGLYIVLHGHVTPGGGFAGGVIIALSFVHLMLAFGKEQAFRKLSEQGAIGVASFGVLLFLGVALLGFAGGAFFQNVFPKSEAFELLSAGAIALSDIAICLNVGAGLFAVMAALVLLKTGMERDQ